jgi:predicted permease
MPSAWSGYGGLIVGNSLFLAAVFAGTVVFGGVLRLSSRTVRTFFICLAFSNIAYLGIPVLTQVFGAAALPSLTLVTAVYLFWIFTAGIGFLDYGQQASGSHVVRNILVHLSKNPLLWAVGAGLLVSMAGISVPDLVLRSFDMVSASVTPLMLVVIGLFVGGSRWGSPREWMPAFCLTFLTLFVLPAAGWHLFSVFGMPSDQWRISVLEAAMPLALTPFALADRFRLDKDLIVRSIALSTALSVFSLPFWIALTG